VSRREVLGQFLWSCFSVLAINVDAILAGITVWVESARPVS